MCDNSLRPGLFKNFFTNAEPLIKEVSSSIETELASTKLIFKMLIVYPIPKSVFIYPVSV